MKAQQLRTIIISHDDLVLVHAALTKLRNGQGLTAIESGVEDEDSIRDVDLVGDPPPMIFDGTFYTQILYVTLG